jgi:peptidoglycan/xylan/chitin deacetylase (PgdA/CDA1 family)
VPAHLNVVNSLRDVRHQSSWLGRQYAQFREVAASLKSYVQADRAGGSWLRLVFYHSVFADEARSFRAQLRAFRNVADLISLEQATDILSDRRSKSGRYISISFDDGLRCCHQYATPILADEGASAAFFLITDYVEHAGVPRQIHRSPGCRYYAEYLTWEECNEMAAAGMEIGSHTCTHPRLSKLTSEETRTEMALSKQAIEDNLGQPCRHFACPWGRPDIDWIVGRDEAMARELGYRCFLAVQPGPADPMSQAFPLRRNFASAGWSPSRALRAALRRTD